MNQRDNFNLEDKDYLAPSVSVITVSSLAEDAESHPSTDAFVSFGRPLVPMH